MDLVPVWYEDRYCPSPQLPPPPPPPPPHTHTHTHTQVISKSRSRTEFSINKTVQYQASYPVWRQVLFSFCHNMPCFVACLWGEKTHKKKTKKTHTHTKIGGFNPHRGRQHSFVEIDHEIFSTVILSLPLIQEGQLSVSGERMCTILVNRLED